jgi:hypothetical protein
MKFRHKSCPRVSYVYFLVACSISAYFVSIMKLESSFYKYQIKNCLHIFSHYWLALPFFSTHGRRTLPHYYLFIQSMTFCYCHHFSSTCSCPSVHLYILIIFFQSTMPIGTILYWNDVCDVLYKKFSLYPRKRSLGGT